MEAAGEGRAEGWFQTLRAIKAVGGRIIEFLHQIEEFQKMLWEKRKFILVEMADYFDTVLLPRIKKVTFTPEWREGKPKRMATAEEAERSPRIVKVIRLESYEDSLNNIAFDAAAGQSAMQFDDYLLQYMLRWETRASETLLNVDKLASPFSYQLQLHADGQTTEKSVDIPETFAYLLGLHVRTRQVHDDDGPALPGLPWQHRPRHSCGHLARHRRLGPGRLPARPFFVVEHKLADGRGRGLRQRRFLHPRRAGAGADLQGAHVCAGGGVACGPSEQRPPASTSSSKNA